MIRLIVCILITAGLTYAACRYPNQVEPPPACHVRQGFELYSSVKTDDTLTCYYLRAAEKYGRGLYRSEQKLKSK